MTDRTSTSFPTGEVHEIRTTPLVGHSAITVAKWTCRSSKGNPDGMRCLKPRPCTQAAPGSAGARLSGADTGADLNDGPSGMGSGPGIESNGPGTTSGMRFHQWRRLANSFGRLEVLGAEAPRRPVDKSGDPLRRACPIDWQLSRPVWRIAVSPACQPKKYVQVAGKTGPCKIITGRPHCLLLPRSFCQQTAQTAVRSLKVGCAQLRLASAY